MRGHVPPRNAAQQRAPDTYSYARFSIRLSKEPAPLASIGERWWLEDAWGMEEIVYSQEESVRFI